MVSMRLVVLVFILFFARIASAQIVISEIMYDPQGGDAGHEWVEIVNEGSTAIDLSQSKFFEEGSNHALAVVQGEPLLAVGAYAIIADDAQKFISSHTGFTGHLLDSTFSLKNTGEAISFKTPDGNISDTVAYASDMGANGDGNSLQKINGTWKGSTPTPGSENILSQSTNTPSQNSAPTSSASNSPNIPTPASLELSAEAGPQVRVVLAGEPVVFEGRISGLQSNASSPTRTAWTFGDGSSGIGETVSHAYYYPGEYTAIIDVSSGSYSATDRMLVRVVLPNISMQTGGDTTRSFITIENQGGDELDLSSWQVASGEKKFVFPKNTILAARKTVAFASEVTGLTTPVGSSVELMFPNGASVPIKSKVAAEAPVLTKKTQKSPPQLIPVVSSANTMQSSQKASVIDAFNAPQALPQGETGTLWPWYIGAAFLGVLALLGIRLTRAKGEEPGLSADDFEIIEDEEPH